MENNKNEFLDRLNDIMEKTKDANIGVNSQSTIDNMSVTLENNYTDTDIDDTVINTPDPNADIDTSDLDLGVHNEDLDIDATDIRDLVNEINSAYDNNEIEEDEAIEEPVMVNPQPAPQTHKSRAELAQEKYAPITRKDPEPETAKPTNGKPQTGDALFDTADNLDKEIAERSARLAKMQEQAMREQQQREIVPPVEDPNTTENDTGGDDINSIIASLGEVPIEKKEEEQDLEKLLEEYETNKIYTDLPSMESTAGPSDYLVESDEEFESNIETILERNDIKVVNKNTAERDAILDKYVNSGDRITMVLPNSGIYVTMSGAGATEIIDMNSMTRGMSDTQYELEKLNHICQHITGSSVGKLKLAELIKIVSYWDIDCLYYALFAATHPTISEISKHCDKCGQEYYLKAHTKDLMINPEDFEKDITDIRDNVTTMARLKETSKLGKVYKKAHSNGMIVYYKHPSIESYLRTQNALTETTKEKHDSIIDLAYGIDKIAIRVKGNEFIEYTDPNEIINIVSKMKNVDEKYEIYDMIETITPNAKPIFGFKETVCPVCGGTSSMTTFTMDSLLFTQAQLEEYEASLRWAVRAQKRNQDRKKSKNA